MTAGPVEFILVPLPLTGQAPADPGWHGRRYWQGALDLLIALVERPGRVLPKRELLTA